MVAPIPLELKSLVQTMLPTIPVDRLIMTSDWLATKGRSTPHQGIDIQADRNWENCNGDKTNGRGEPVCSPITGKILRIDVDERTQLIDPKTKDKIDNPHYGKMCGILIAEVDADGKWMPNGHVVGLRHMIMPSGWKTIWQYKKGSR